jgi:hypothetical protein
MSITTWDDNKPHWKPARGTYKLEKERLRKEAEDLETKHKNEAKHRDGWDCRWPEKHKCRGILEGVHVFVDKGMGGDHGAVSNTWNLMAFCSWIHRTGPQSIHSKDLWVEPITDRGADDICQFWRRGEDGVPYLVGKEVSIGALERGI